MEASRSATPTSGECSEKGGTTWSAFFQKARTVPVMTVRHWSSSLREVRIHKPSSMRRRRIKATWILYTKTETSRLSCRVPTHWQDLSSRCACTGILFVFSHHSLFVFSLVSNFLLLIHSLNIIGTLLSPSFLQDGMDQSKWRLPRFHGPQGQRPLKSTMNLQRHQLKVQGVWCHNVCLDLWDTWPFFS